METPAKIADTRLCDQLEPTRGVEQCTFTFPVVARFVLKSNCCRPVAADTAVSKFQLQPWLMGLRLVNNAPTAFQSSKIHEFANPNASAILAYWHF